MVAQRPALDPDWVESAFARVEEVVYEGDADAISAAVAELATEHALATTGGTP